MSLGTLFIKERSSRCVSAKAIIRHYNLDIAVKKRDDADYQNHFPLNKTPAFLSSNGFKLHEVIAVLLHLVGLSDEATEQLLGKNKQEYVEIIKWMSLANCDYSSTSEAVIEPILGKARYILESVEAASESLDAIMGVFEERLSEHRYLVGDSISLADLFCVGILARGFEFLYGVRWRCDHFLVSRWFSSVISSSFYVGSEFTDFEFRNNPIQYRQVKREQKLEKRWRERSSTILQQPTANCHEIAFTPRRHPLYKLGRSKLCLDEWKLVYRNRDTRKEAIPWFWSHFDAEEWSLYRLDYKYNHELTLAFMSNNLVGGFLNRLVSSTRYIFGCMVVYGEDNDNGITGAFMVRGQDHVAAFDSAADWESYEYRKLDPNDEQTKTFVNNMWALDEPVEVDGRKIEIEYGEVFK